MNLEVCSEEDRAATDLKEPLEKDDSSVDEEDIDATEVVDTSEGDRVLLSKCPVAPKPVDDFLFTVISTKRAANVKAMELKLEGCSPHWIVGSGEADDYEKAGAHFVIEGGGLCASRNAALEAAFSAEKICVQISDDVHSLSFVDSSRDADWKPPKSLSHANDVAKAANIYLVSFVAAARYIESCARHLGAKLGGVYPCPNEGQACGGPPLVTQHFVVGDFIVVMDSKPRFDIAMTLKEDYDMTAQHLFLYGIVARSNRIVIRADHYSNAGGAVACRNKTREAQNIKHLRQKWPGAFLNSPRGPQEVRLRWDKRDVAIGGTRIYEPDPKNPGRAIYDQEEAKRVRERRLEKEAAGNKRPKVKS